MSRSINALKVALATLAIGGAMAVAQPAAADVLLGVTNTDAQIFTGPPTLVDLNGPVGGGTVVEFFSTSPGPIVITFNAECSIAGDFQAWVNVDVIIDPAGPVGGSVVAPSNSDNAFCAGGSDAQDNWVSAAVVTPYVLPTAGRHLVSVRVSRGFTSGAGSQNIRIDDTSLTVVK